MQFPDDVLLYLGYDPDDKFKVGSWFSVSEAAVLKRSGVPFAPAKAKKDMRGRRVVLASNRVGPNATLYPRTASGRSGYRHQRHSHGADFPRCEISKDGRVPRVPVTVDEAELSDNWSCVEPDASGLYVTMRQWLRS